MSALDRYERCPEEGTWYRVHDGKLERMHDHVLAKLDALDARLDMQDAALAELTAALREFFEVLARGGE